MSRKTKNNKVEVEIKNEPQEFNLSKRKIKKLRKAEEKAAAKAGCRIKIER